MSFIYFIRAIEDGPIKIGTTKFNPLRRMVKIQSDCPWPVKLLGAIEGSVTQEKKIHAVLSSFRTQGEWFIAHPKVIAAVNLALDCGKRAHFKKQKRAQHQHPLCAYRAANSMTVSDIAKLTGLTAASISRFETRRQKPSAQSLRALVKATGLTAMDLRPDWANIISGSA